MDNNVKNLFDQLDELKAKVANGTITLIEKAQYRIMIAVLVQNISEEYDPKPERGKKSPWDLTQEEIQSLSSQDLSFSYDKNLDPEKSPELTTVHAGVKSSYVQDKSWYTSQGLKIYLLDEEGNQVIDNDGNASYELVKDNLSYVRYLRQNGLPLPEWLDVKESAFITDYDVCASFNGPVKKVHDVVVIKDKK